jgi:pimeloyl-ACP methyl ester carboxylesterase
MQAEINGIQLFYTDRGNADGIPVIFIHGFPFSHRMWDGQISALPKRFRPVAFDIRGHGQSEAGDGQYSLEFFVEDLYGLMDHLNIPKAILCGLSMGGYIVLRAAEKEPERILGLVLCDTRSEADSNEARIKRAATLKSLKKDGQKIFAANFLKGVFREESFSQKPAAVEKIRSIIESNPFIGIGGTIMALAARTDTTASLEKMKFPVLIMAGQEDSITPPIAAEAMHEKLENSELHVIPDAAHMSNLENEQEFNGYLLEFLERF